MIDVTCRYWTLSGSLKTTSCRWRPVAFDRGGNHLVGVTGRMQPESALLRLFGGMIRHGLLS